MAGKDVMKGEHGGENLGVIIDPGEKNIAGNNRELSPKNTRKGCLATVCGYNL